MSVRLIVFDDARARRWAPFAGVRPVGELRYGSSLLRQRLESAAGVPCELHLCGRELHGWDEPGAPPAATRSQVSAEGTRVFWSSRAVPAAGVRIPTDHRATFFMAGQPVGWCMAEDQPVPSDAELAVPETLDAGSRIELEGEVLGWPWDLVSRNAPRLAADLDASYGADDVGPLPGVSRIGNASLSLGAGAELGPGVVVDTRAGTIRLDDDVTVDGPARLVGPLHLGSGTQVFGGVLARVAAGPVCRLRGEVDSSVLLGYANKAHDGYLGHALVGRWVNLGALTTNSDLKNSYSPVRVELPDGLVDTDLLKVGALLGDHVKTGIGTLLTTGALVGAGANVFGGGTPPRHVPAFAWGGAGGWVPYRFEKFVEVATAAMARRGQKLTPGVRAVLERAWGRAHGAP